MEDMAVIKLKEIGLKITPQRQAILKLLRRNRTHPSAEGIYSEILKKYPGISFATVYNTLSKLIEAGEIRELDIDPNKKRFDPCVTPHTHFYCKVCEKIFDIVCDSSLPLNIKKIDGHQVDVIQLNLKGVCKTCRRTR
jgi:Fur family peroxide stress response transcriptional regulator